MSCVFCDVVAGDLEAEVVFEDDGFLAFLDHRPVRERTTLYGEPPVRAAG